MAKRHFAIVRGEDEIALRPRATPSAEPGGLLVAPLVAGLCGTDLQILRGERSDPAQVLGHEGVARVLTAGAGAPAGLSTGTHVIINPTHPDDPSLLLGHLQDGLFQEAVAIPAAMVSAGLVQPLPADLPARLAPLIEPLACVLYAFELMRRKVRPGPLILYGDGIVGHLALMAAPAHLPSADSVTLVHHSREGLRWSRAHGLNAHRHLVFGDATREPNAGYAAALLATPRRASLACLTDAVPRMAEHGVIDLLGGLPARARLNALPDIPDLAAIRHGNCGGLPTTGRYWAAFSGRGLPLLLFGHRGVPNRLLHAAVLELAAQAERYQPLVTHLLSLPEAACLLDQLRRAPQRHCHNQRFLKVGIVFPDTGPMLRANGASIP